MTERDLGDRITAWIHDGAWRRYRLPIELGLGVLYLIVSVVEAHREGGALAPFALFLVATAFPLYRVAPLTGLFTVGLGGVLVLSSGWSTGAPPVWIWLPVLLALFGSTAYGRPVTKWFGLAGVVIAGVLVSAATISDVFALGFLVLFSFWATFFGAPWLAGLLWRTRKERAAARETAQVVTERLGEARQEISLEQERNRVARDVHDIVAHSLAVVIAQADGARYANRDASPAVKEALETISQTARGALTDVRVLLGELRHNQESGPQPGVDDLDALVRGFRESGLDIQWTSYGEATRVSDATGLAIYRIVQEALTNALRHGERTAPVELVFDWGMSSLAITVTNAIADGAVPNPGGHGLPGMRERAHLAGGDLDAGRGTSGRFRVRAILPVDRVGTGATPVIREAPPGASPAHEGAAS